MWVWGVGGCGWVWVCLAATTGFVLAKGTLQMAYLFWIEVYPKQIVFVVTSIQ